MRALSLTTLAALAFVAVSCDSTPVEPPGVEAEASAPLFMANQGWVYGSFDVDFVTNVSCLGEDVRFYGYVPYKLHRVFKSSGGYSDFFALEPATPNLPFLAEGMSSGIVWKARGSTNPQSYRVGPGEVTHVTITETYISKDGPTLRSMGGMHITVNANGEVTVSSPFVAETVCTGRG